MGLVARYFPGIEAGVARVIWGLGTVAAGLFCIGKSIATMNSFFFIAGALCLLFSLIPLRQTPQSVRGIRGAVVRVVYGFGMLLAFFVYGMGVVSMR